MPLRQKRAICSATPARPSKNNLEATFMVRAFCLLAPLAVAAISGLTPTPASAQDEKPYSVVNGKVDKGTFNGWRRYTDACMRCHGPDGSGSSYGPVLSDSLKTMTYEQFTDTVINGRKNVTVEPAERHARVR